MQVTDFSFTLPEHLIAHYPTKERTSSRLLCLDGSTGAMQHNVFTDVLELFNAGDLLVLNNTRVIPARLFGTKTTGGKVELLIERIINAHDCLAHIKSSRAPKIGSQINLDAHHSMVVTGRQGSLFALSLIQDNLNPNDPSPNVLSQATSMPPAKVTHITDMLHQLGHVPLPPYINRADQASDLERYQTVYGQIEGAVAAPTAGLHFDQSLLDALQTKGVNIATITLHVGAGTFQPVKVDTITEHKMHHEWLQVDQATVDLVTQTRKQNKRVIAVGTTSVRALETASQSGRLAPFSGETNMFIYPGYQFKSVDAMVTNFHLSQSTLLMLVSAFAGRDHILTAYQEAIEHEYRFFSYGDAMFITPNIDFTHTNTIHPSNNEI